MTITRAGPDPAAEHAVGEELAEAHAGGAGDEGSEGADEADEAADEDRFAAVAGEEVLHLVEALVGEAEARAVLIRKSRPRRRPRKKLVTSPAQAIVQASAIST